jgi:Flp pilus assembly pilin Flp
MKFFYTWLGQLARDRRGQDMIEYALLGAFIAVVVAAFFPTMIGPNISTVFSKVASQLINAGNQSGG